MNEALNPNKQSLNVLIIEDDVQAAQQLAELLADAGHQSTQAHDGLAGAEAALETTFDVLVVDRMLPEIDGLSLITRLRERGIKTPILILSAMGQVDDRVTGLRAGGDDYLTKPYAFSELLARLEILARRVDVAQSETMITVDDLTLDLIKHEAERSGQAIALQPREYRLLEFLMKNAGRLVTRAMLLQHVWNLHFDPQTNVIDVHMSRLRAKIDKEFDYPLLHTVRGRGYILQPKTEGS
ncbi:MAG: response regulator transcription factor [Pseudomonadota bacterium]